MICVCWIHHSTTGWLVVDGWCFTILGIPERDHDFGILPRVVECQHEPPSQLAIRANREADGVVTSIPGMVQTPPKGQGPRCRKTD